MTEAPQSIPSIISEIFHFHLRFAFLNERAYTAKNAKLWQSHIDSLSINSQNYEFFWQMKCNRHIQTVCGVIILQMCDLKLLTKWKKNELGHVAKYVRVIKYLYESIIVLEN